MVFLVEDYVNLPTEQISNIWLAAHKQKLNRKDIKKTELGKACEQLHSDKTKKPMQLRHYAQCLIGISWIHYKQVEFLHSECDAAFSKARIVLVRKRNIDLDPSHQRGRDLTLPEARARGGAQPTDNALAVPDDVDDFMRDIHLTDDTAGSQLLLHADDVSSLASVMGTVSNAGARDGGDHLAADHEITLPQRELASPSRRSSHLGLGLASIGRRDSFGAMSSLHELDAADQFDIEIEFDDANAFDHGEVLDESKAQRTQNTDSVSFDDDASVEHGRGAVVDQSLLMQQQQQNLSHDHVSDIGSIGHGHALASIPDNASQVSLEKDATRPELLDELGSVHSAVRSMNIGIDDEHAVEDQASLHVDFDLDAQSKTASVATAVLSHAEQQQLQVQEQEQREEATPPVSPIAKKKNKNQTQTEQEQSPQKKKKDDKKKKKRRKKRFAEDKEIELAQDELRVSDPSRFQFEGRDVVHIWREVPLASLEFEDLLYRPLSKQHFGGDGGGGMPRDVCQGFYELNKTGRLKHAADDAAGADDTGVDVDVDMVRDENEVQLDDVELGRVDHDADVFPELNELALSMHEDGVAAADKTHHLDDVLDHASSIYEPEQPVLDMDDALSNLDSVVNDAIPAPPIDELDGEQPPLQLSLESHDTASVDEQQHNIDDMREHRERAAQLGLRDWSKRAKKTFAYFKNQPEKEFSFDEMMKAGTKRETVVGIFYELLVFKNSDLVDLQQTEPYGDITITKTDNFYRHAMLSQQWAKRLSQSQPQ
eukprot:CAMPEP_0202685552 /NCGR_PEP_ID=MMETSP1385-20130828/1344_1 /ASSEMBLY_ACC=CAM_ASM_000861 /TAXON_ID=933848 /ORGANISM="Elphidium margaritaceum" /LENGTH=767 /DNA_ID=CAMNT_0049339931 /DNA_START=31 /DNA_END=2334 /DNA_ORIENTATION=+